MEHWKVNIIEFRAINDGVTLVYKQGLLGDLIPGYSKICPFFLPLNPQSENKFV